MNYVAVAVAGAMQQQMVPLSTAQKRTSATTQTIHSLVFAGPVQAEDTSSCRLQPCCFLSLCEAVEVGAVAKACAVDYLAVPLLVSVSLVADRAVS